MSKNLNDLKKALSEIDKHGVASLIAQSDVGDRMTKKCRVSKLPPPDWSNGLISLTRSVVNVHHDYQKTINNQLLKTGMVPDFEAVQSTVSEPIPGFPNEVLRQGVSNPEQLYVRVYIEMGVKTTLETIYLNGQGKIVTELVTEEFKENFFPKKYGSQKQAEHGVSKEIKPRDYKAENILYIQKGDVVFNNLSKDVLELFGLEFVAA